MDERDTKQLIAALTSEVKISNFKLGLILGFVSTGAIVGLVKKYITKREQEEEA